MIQKEVEWLKQVLKARTIGENHQQLIDISLVQLHCHSLRFLLVSLSTFPPLLN